MFSVTNDQLVGAEQIEPLPHRNTRITPRYITLHYTGGGDMDAAINYLRWRGYSYHILIDRDGRVVQAAPLTKRASHAGYSNWKGHTNLNDHAIGISFANWGFLDRHGTSYYRSTSHGDLITPIFSEEEVVAARHWNGHTGSTVMGWERYTEAQYAALIAVCAALREAYPTIVDVNSHEEIAVGRKPDPGMSFDWSRIYPHFERRAADLGPLYRVHVSPDDTLNVRKGPSGGWSAVDALPRDCRVHLRSFAYSYKNGRPVMSKWAAIAREGSTEHLGFTHSGYLRAV